MTLRERAPRRRALTFSAIVVACLVLLAVGRTEPAQELRRGVNFAVSPLQAALASGTRSVAQVLGALAEMDRLRQENLALQSEVERLAQAVAQLESLGDENARLARALETRRTADHETMVAEVIGRHATQFERVLTVDRGTDRGIELGDAVLAEGGALVGSVVEVGPSYSFVRLLSDSRSLVVGRDVRTRATGLVTGRLSQPLEMADIPAPDEVEVGHTVVTAGISDGRRFQSPYPAGLLIGRIIDVQQDRDSVVQTALIEPAVDMDHLETVLIITDYEVRRVPSPTPLDEAS